MTENTIANDYVAHVTAGRYAELLDALYAEDAVSVEACERPGAPRVVEGLDAIRVKGQQFDEHVRVDHQEIRGPWPHGEDRFAVHMSFETTHRASGAKSTLEEVAVLTVRDGKIVREEFFYEE
jgi:ketosteroid isomerase-like protein